MDIIIKGKFFISILLIIFFNFSYIISTTDSDHTHDPIDPTQVLNTLNQHISQLGKLDELVKNLTELVNKLESRVSVSNSDSIRKSVDGFVKIPDLEPLDRKTDDNNDNNNIGYVTDSTDVTDVTDSKIERLGAVSVTKHSLFWSERFQFVSAVKLDTIPTSLNVLPFKDVEGLSKYIAVGDNVGNLYVFTRYGEVMLQFDTLTNSPVTAVLSYLSVVKNESMVITGHENGVILVHKVWEVPNGDELSSIYKETVRKLDHTQASGSGSGSAINILEIHHVGRTRYIVSIDVSGAIRVFKEEGAVMGTIVPNSRPIVVLKQKLLFLTETGAGSLDLRSMKLREAPCDGFNGSHALNYVLDASDRGKAYAFTSSGEVVHLLIYGDLLNFKCRVRSKKKFDIDRGPLAFEAIKGYFLIVSRDKVSVYNVSSQLYVRAGLPRPVFSAGLDEIVSSFLNYRAIGRLDNRKAESRPLIASDHEKLVILSLGNGYIGMYQSNLPVTKGEFNTMLWSTPVLFFILFLFVAWHFFARKKDAFTLFGPDDPFVNGPPTGAGERAFGDAGLDMRSGGNNGGDGGGLRGLSRRYGSPTRYAGTGSNSYRPSVIDPNPRAGSVEPDYMGSELKYRGSMEAGGFGKRREGLFVNSQVVDDHGS